jgi:hypothetical protein
MTYFETHALIRDNKLTELLRNLEPGSHDLKFNSVAQIASLKAIAYSINSDHTNGGRKYFFHVDKGSLRVQITVTE